MNTENNAEEQNENLKEMNYNASEDIFNKEEHISLDGDGNPILNNNQKDGMLFGLDIPGVEDDDKFEQFTSQIPTENESVHNSDETETLPD